jgi:hypothetical protein
MKNATYILLLIALAGTAGYWGAPWWAIMPAGLLGGFLFPVAPGRAYAIGFAAGFALWNLNALAAHTANAGMLTAKIGELFQGLQSWHLLVLTGTIGGFLAGIGVLAGVYGRALWK